MLNRSWPGGIRPTDAAAPAGRNSRCSTTKHVRNPRTCKAIAHTVTHTGPYIINLDTYCNRARAVGNHDDVIWIVHWHHPISGKTHPVAPLTAACGPADTSRRNIHTILLPIIIIHQLRANTVKEATAADKTSPTSFQQISRESCHKMPHHAVIR